MRVLHLLRTLTVGGIEPHVVTLGKALGAHGCEIAIASDPGVSCNAHNAGWLRTNGIRHFKVRFPSPGASGSLLFDSLHGAVDLKRAVAEFLPDLLHVHYRAVSPYAKGAQLLSGLPFISTLHMTGIPAGLPYRLASFWGDRTIAISKEVKDYLEGAFRLNPRRIRTIHNGVDADHFRPPTPCEAAEARDVLGVPQNASVIGMIARMSPVKGHDVLLKALAALKRVRCRPHVLLAGVSITQDTLWRDRMMSVATELGLRDRIHFLGQTDARTVYWASDITVLPSRQEGFPLAIVESMMCARVPVRTPAAGAYEQIDDGKNGFVIPFDDPDALADRVKRLFDEPDQRRAMAEAGRRKSAQIFSAAHMARATYDVYTEVVSDAGRVADLRLHTSQRPPGAP